MWRSPECPRFTLPLAVFLKRLDAPLCDFNFGISPRNQLPAIGSQLSALDIQPPNKLLWSRSTRRAAKLAKPDSELPHLPPAPAAFLFPAPASSPASPSAWLLVLFPSRVRPLFSSAPGWRAACCLPASAGTP